MSDKVTRFPDDRAARLARFDVSTLSETEIEIVQSYRELCAPVRGAFVTLIRHAIAEQNKAKAGR